MQDSWRSTCNSLWEQSRGGGSGERTEMLSPLFLAWEIQQKLSSLFRVFLNYPESDLTVCNLVFG